MAQPKPEMNAFLREVDESLHYDRMQELWNTYKTWVYAGLVALFVTVGGWTWYEQAHEAGLENEADKYWNIFNTQSEPTATDFEAYAENADSGYALLAKFQAAGAYTEAGNLTEAEKTYSQIAQEYQNQPIYRDLANFYKGLVLMKTDMNKAESTLVLLDTPASAYRASALEMLGHIAEHKGEKAKAVTYFERLLSLPNIPNGAAVRAQDRLDELG